MAEIYFARDRELGRPVAVSCWTKRLAEVPEARRRFTREARTAFASRILATPA
jgi:hypothetical protein